MIDSLISLFDQISPQMAYFLLTVSAFAENVLPPVPGDTVVVFGAYLVSKGQLSFLGVFLSTTIGSVIGFMTMFLIARTFGRQFITSNKSRAKIFKVEQLKKVEIWFGNWGYLVILANRFLAGTRSVISIFSGIFHLNIVLVLILSLLSTCIWNSILIFAGVLVGNNWELILTIISQYNKILIFLTVLVIGYILYRRYKKKHQRPAGTPPADLSDTE
jgi:membrane protein DedA with SNARE-associated domain